MGEEQPLLLDDETAHTFTRLSTRRGYFYAAIGSLFFSVSSILFHVSETRMSVPPPASVLTMGIVYLPSSLIPLFLLEGRSGLKLSSHTFGWLALRGLFGTLSVVCLMTAFDSLPTGDVSSIFFTSPVFTMLLAIPLVAEYPSCGELTAASVSLLGAVVIAFGDHVDAATNASPESLYASMFAFAGALMGAMGYAVARKLGNGVHYLLHTAVMGLGCLLAGLLIKCLNGLGSEGAAGTTILSWGFALPIAGSALGWCGHVAVHSGIQISRAGATLIVRNVEIPLLYIMSAVVLKEAPGVFQVCGATLIVIASIATAFMKTENDAVHG